MSWSPDALNMNLDSGGTPATQFTNALSGSTVNITLSDPYMTGASWAVMFDTAAAYTNESLAAANHIILPKCAPGQVSTKQNPCRPILGSSEIEDIGEKSAVLARFAHVIVIFYYEVAGVTFSLETYFRVQRFNIVHGKSYPKVTIAGVDPQTVTFNQKLQNFQMKENQTLEENLKEVAKGFGYRVSFCNSPEANYGQKYIMPAGFREKQVTGEEVLKKYINSVGGTFGKMPTKEYANKISVCTRANVNQGCSVFYLGKGLYEGYQINGQVERDQLNVNAENEFNRGLGVDYDTKPLDEQKYTLEDTFPEKRKAKLRGAKTSITSFPEQFEVAKKRLFETQITSGYIWRGNGPEVNNTKVESTNFYGVGVNNNVPIALLEGTVQALSRDTGTMMIFTDYVFKVCEKDKQCTIRPIWQEVVNLATIEPILKVNDRVSKNVVLGTATAEKKWYTRFFIKVNAGNNTNVTPAPNLVWSYATPVKDLTDEEKKSAGIKVIEQSPESSTAPGSPTPQASSSDTSAYAGRTGNTGSSTAPHLHAELFPDRNSGGRGLPLTNADVDPYIRVGGKAPSEWGVTSGYGQQPNRFHNGIDYGTPVGQPITVIGGAKILRKRPNFGKYGNAVEIERPDGKVLLLAHLEDGSLESVVPGTTGEGSSSRSSKYGQGVQNSPVPVGVTVETEFKGIPRALRIVPGRTILSFVTEYDKWIEEGRPDTIDPGVWIPERFSAWMIKSAEYRWDGDLRVKVSAVSDWGVSIRPLLSFPKFKDYLVTENFKYKDYYGYIRGLGDLCWTLGNGKNSCDERCKEAEEIREYLQRSKESEQQAQSGSVSNSFPPGDYSYIGEYAKSSKSTIENTISALKSVGITNPIAYAGVLGNFSVESNFNFNVHNSGNPGSGCSTTPSRVLGTSGYGIAQLCGSRADNLAAKCGRNCTEQEQLEFVVQEIREGRDVFPINGVNIVDAMNRARTPQEAADLWNRYYERGPGGIQKRRDEAIKIWNSGQNFRKN